MDSTQVAALVVVIGAGLLFLVYRGILWLLSEHPEGTSDHSNGYPASMDIIIDSAFPSFKKFSDRDIAMSKYPTTNPYDPVNFRALASSITVPPPRNMLPVKCGECKTTLIPIKDEIIKVLQNGQLLELCAGCWIKNGPTLPISANKQA